jgi:hypothetical protein
MPDDSEALVRRWRDEVTGELVKLGLCHREWVVASAVAFA